MRTCARGGNDGSVSVESARRVGGGLIAALNVGGLRTGAGAPSDAGSERPAGREGERRVEQGGTALRCPARLVKQPVRHSARVTRSSAGLSPAVPMIESLGAPKTSLEQEKSD